MKIISHRGYWKDASEKNTIEAFQRSFSNAFGIETDLRDYLGKIVIAHDMPNNSNPLLEELLKIYNNGNLDLPLALNIKSDGLNKELIAIIKQYSVENYFVFDMSIPDTLGYIKYGIKFFSRQSEYEPSPVFYDDCSGIWLDSFECQWYTASLIREHLSNGKMVSIVSPELHKREHLPIWQYLKEEAIQTQKNILFCTDYPEDAKQFFEL